MDWYTAALKRLVADSRSCQKLEDVTGVKGRTISDIKCGKTRFDFVRLGTARLITKHYFPSALK